MGTGKAVNTSKCIIGELSTEILSPNDTINNKTLYKMLKEKISTPFEANFNFVVDKNTSESRPYQPLSLQK